MASVIKSGEIANIPISIEESSKRGRFEGLIITRKNRTSTGICEYSPRNCNTYSECESRLYTSNGCLQYNHKMQIIAARRYWRVARLWNRRKKKKQDEIEQQEENRIELWCSSFWRLHDYSVYMLLLTVLSVFELLSVENKDLLCLYFRRQFEYDGLKLIVLCLYTRKSQWIWNVENKLE